MAPLITPLVNTIDAVDHDKQGTKTTGSGQFVAASEAIYKEKNLNCSFKFWVDEKRPEKLR